MNLPIYSSAYGIYVLVIFVILFVVFLVLYLVERNKVDSSSDTTSKTAAQSVIQFPSDTSETLEKPVVERSEKSNMSEKSNGFVTVEMMGGLGNQLFQIATAYSYAKTHNKTLILDHRQKQLGNRHTYFDTVYSWVQDSADIKRKNWHKIAEPHFHYAPIPDHFGNIRLNGYFQSLKYFAPHKKELVTLFKYGTPSIPENHPTYERVQNSRISNIPTVSLHIRRSDYVGNSFHPVQPLSYYVQAVQKICEIIQDREDCVKDTEDCVKDKDTEDCVKDTEEQTIADEEVCIVVFSDDIPWCKEHLPKEFSALPVVFEYTESATLMDAQELVLMSLCNHHVIANSSFSWWGAMYDEKPDTIVIAPKLWFNGNTHNWQDIYCPDWIVI